MNSPKVFLLSIEVAVSIALSLKPEFVFVGFGKVQVQLTVLICLVLFNVLNETIGISFLIPAAQCDLDLSTRDKGLLSSMVFFGEIFLLESL